jgi:hypothetical protein
VLVGFYNVNVLPWFVSELPEKIFQTWRSICRWRSTISCRGLYLNYLKKISVIINVHTIDNLTYTLYNSTPCISEHNT